MTENDRSDAKPDKPTSDKGGGARARHDKGGSAAPDSPRDGNPPPDGEIIAELGDELGGPA
jgi:hypothetical protein